MHDLTAVLTDSELGGTDFLISRKTYRREMGEVIPSEISGFSSSGNIQPAAAEELRLLPEEERSEEVIIILSPFHLRLGETDELNHTFTTADIITWKGKKYRVVRVKSWDGQGGFYKAWAVRLKEASGIG